MSDAADEVVEYLRDTFRCAEDVDELSQRVAFLEELIVSILRGELEAAQNDPFFGYEWSDKVLEMMERVDQIKEYRRV